MQTVARKHEMQIKNSYFSFTDCPIFFFFFFFLKINKLVAIDVMDKQKSQLKLRLCRVNKKNTYGREGGQTDRRTTETTP